jgi:hypothetical protein
VSTYYYTYYYRMNASHRPDTTICVSTYYYTYYYIMNASHRPDTTIYVSTYYYTYYYIMNASHRPDRLEKKRSSYYYIRVLILLCVSSYYYICVLILLFMRPHTTTSPHTTTICVHILLCMRPHTATYVSSYYFICVLTLLNKQELSLRQERRGQRSPTDSLVHAKGAGHSLPLGLGMVRGSVAGGGQGMSVPSPSRGCRWRRM